MEVPVASRHRQGRVRLHRGLTMFALAVAFLLLPAELTGFRVFDGAGNPVTDAMVTAYSGYDYLHPGQHAVPETSTLFLLASSLTGLGLLVRRKRMGG